MKKFISLFLSILLLSMPFLAMADGLASQEAETFSITYQDGVENQIFKQKTYIVKAGEKTPVFTVEASVREGHEFSGWSPNFEQTVTKDVTYIAQWKQLLAKSEEDITQTPPYVPPNEPEKSAEDITPNPDEPVTIPENKEIAPNNKQKNTDPLITFDEPAITEEENNANTNNKADSTDDNEKMPPEGITTDDPKNEDGGKDLPAETDQADQPSTTESNSDTPVPSDDPPTIAVPTESIQSTESTPTDNADTAIPASDETYTVKYYGNNTIYGNLPKDSNTYQSGDEVTVMGIGTASSPGYIFQYWTLDKEGLGQRYNPDDTHTITANTIFYAQWELDTSIDQIGVLVVDNTFVHKEGSYIEGYKVPGVTYKLYKTEDNSLVDTQTSDENGQLTFYVPRNIVYYIVQSEAPQGFNKDDKQHQLVAAGSELPQIKSSSITLTLSRVRAPLELTVQDKNTGAPIPNVTLEMYFKHPQFGELSLSEHMRSQDFGTAIKTDENGKFTIANLPAGSYRIEETSAIDGYQKMSDTSFSTGQNNLVLEKVPVKALYTVTYTDGVAGATYFADQKYTVEEGSETPAFEGTPTRENYIFVDWNPLVADTVTENVTYAAQWESNNISVYDLAGVDSALSSPDGLGTITGRIAKSHVKPEDLTPPVAGATIILYEYDGNWIPVPGKELARGTTDENGNFAIKVKPNNRGKDIYIVVKASKGESQQPQGQHATTFLRGISPLVKIHFKTSSGEVLAPQEDLWGEFGETYTIKPKDIPGYKHTTTEGESTGTFTSNVKTLTFIYTKLTNYTVTYTDGVDNEIIFADQTFTTTEGSDTPSFSGTPSRQGYTFTGWDPPIEDKVIKDVTYTAQWKADEYTVTYDANGGSGAPVDSKTYIFNAVVTISASEGMKKEYHQFIGWNTQKDGSGTQYNPNNTFNIKENTVLYAQWKPLPTFTVTFVTNGGSTVNPLTGIISGSFITKPVNPTRAGYHFIGWFKENTLNTLWNFATDQVMQNTVLYAKWEPVESSHTVWFDSGGGSYVYPYYNVSHGSTIYAPKNPVRKGYTFTGWYMEPTLNTVWNFKHYGVYNSMTLYAGWKAGSSGSGIPNAGDDGVGPYITMGLISLTIGTACYGLYKKSKRRFNE